MSDLLHAVARVRVLEGNLFSLSQLQRMLDAPSFGEAFSVLDDSGFAQFVSSRREQMDFESILDDGLCETKNLFEQFGVQEILPLLLFSFDLLNVKVLVKAKKKGIAFAELENTLFPYGFFSTHFLQNAVETQKFENNVLLSDALRSAMNVESLHKGDIILENAFFAFASEMAKSKKNTFLMEYVAILKDTENVKRMIRGEKDCMAGGKFSVSAFESEEKCISAFPSSVQSAVSLAFSSFHTHGVSSSVEDILDVVVLELLKDSAKGEIDGYAPLFLYFWKKKRAAALIRNILVAKKNGLSVETIRKSFLSLVI